MGLLFVGTATEKGEEMLAYAHDTQHEKIIRGLSMGLALTMYARCELFCLVIDCQFTEHLDVLGCAQPSDSFRSAM